jgi:hypothetical protein
MIKDKILICGDSFSTNFGHPKSWVALLSEIYTVENLSCAGISEYKILQQIKSKQLDLDGYSKIIISHTSPNRVYIKKHPVHNNSKKHFSSDLIFSDISYHFNVYPNDKIIETAYNYFLHIFDEEYYLEMYYLIQEKIKKIVEGNHVLHLDNFNLSNNANLENYVILQEKLKLTAGDINHYDLTSNFKIFEFLRTTL